MGYKLARFGPSLSGACSDDEEDRKMDSYSEMRKTGCNSWRWKGGELLDGAVAMFGPVGRRSV